VPTTKTPETTECPTALDDPRDQALWSFAVANDQTTLIAAMRHHADMLERTRALAGLRIDAAADLEAAEQKARAAGHALDLGAFEAAVEEIAAALLRAQALRHAFIPNQPMQEAAEAVGRATDTGLLSAWCFRLRAQVEGGMLDAEALPGSWAWVSAHADRHARRAERLREATGVANATTTDPEQRAEAKRVAASLRAEMQRVAVAVG
jgi:hypothetical protein